MHRLLVLFATLVLLWMGVAQLNHALTELRVYVFAGALFVAFSALSQPFRIGLAASVLGGFLCDANAPVAFGTHAALFGLAHAMLFRLRDRVPRGDNASAILVVLLVNLGLFLAFSFTQIHTSPAPASAWPRLLVDLVCSQIVLAVVTPWFFALQTHALQLARVRRLDPA